MGYPSSFFHFWVALTRLARYRFNNEDKGAVTHAVVHHALWEYLDALEMIQDEAERDKGRREIFEMYVVSFLSLTRDGAKMALHRCQDVVAELVHTKDGSRVVREFLARGSAKVIMHSVFSSLLLHPLFPVVGPDVRLLRFFGPRFLDFCSAALPQGFPLLSRFSFALLQFKLCGFWIVLGLSPSLTLPWTILRFGQSALLSPVSFFISHMFLPLSCLTSLVWFCLSGSPHIVLASSLDQIGSLEVLSAPLNFLVLRNASALALSSGWRLRSCRRFGHDSGFCIRFALLSSCSTVYLSKMSFTVVLLFNLYVFFPLSLA